MAKLFTRRTALLVLATLFVAVSVRLLTFQGWLRPLRVQGGSMAMGLLGRHIEIPCDDCGREFACGLEYPPEDNGAVCPNCGYAANRINPSRTVAGRRVMVDRLRFLWSDPQPWQLVAFRSPDKSKPLSVKRLLAVGTGRLEIRDGDVFVNGKIRRKSMRQLMAMRILVHDDRFRPRQDTPLPPRWQSSQPDSRWQTTKDGYRFTPAHADDDAHVDDQSLDWLAYQQWTCWPHPSPPAERTATGPILDHYGYNQGLSRGSLHRVRDLMISCRLQLDRQGQAMVRLSDGVEVFDLELTSDGRRCDLLRNGQRVCSAVGRLPKQPVRLDFALCDQQALVSIHGRATIEYQFQRSGVKRGTQLLAFAAPWGQLGIGNLQVFRDVHYLGPRGASKWKAEASLRGDGVFLLGDNVPISTDSRSWGYLSRKELLGPVVGQ